MYFLHIWPHSTFGMEITTGWDGQSRIKQFRLTTDFDMDSSSFAYEKLLREVSLSIKQFLRIEVQIKQSKLI